MFRRFKVVYQHDAMQCGLACLAMICRYFGRSYTLEQLSKICFATSEGVSMLGISEAARSLGFKPVAAKLGVERLSNTACPCILHWNQNHFVVLCGRKKNKFQIADPAKGLLTLSEEEFCEHWCADSDKGIVLFLEPTDTFRRTNVLKDSDSTPRSFGFLFGYFNRYRKYFLHIIAGLLLGCVLQLILPFLTQSIVDLGIRHADVPLIWLILLGELIIVGARTVTDFVRNRLLLHISMRIDISLVSDFFIKLLRLPMAYFDTKQMGDLLQRIGDHTRLQSFLTVETLNIIFSLLSFVVLGAVLCIYSVSIFAVFIFLSAAYIVWGLLFMRRRRVLDYEIFELQARNQNNTFRFITSMQEIKLQDCEQRRRWEWEDIQADLFKVRMKSLKLQQTQEAGAVFIGELRNVLVTVLAATAVIQGEITLGAMLAVQFIIGQLNSPISQIMNFIYSAQDVKISLERINEVHMSRNEEEDSANSQTPRPGREICHRGLSFKYDPHSLKRTLDYISLTIPPGKVTAIVGASGSGKTTLVKLMLGYYKTSEGSISIDGINLQNVNLKKWRRLCGVVMQDGVIFSESIERNIAVSDGEVDEERLREAARIACIDDFILSLPLGYSTKIGPDGTGLSQGQKQRILIARAIYRNPSYIFLDEATNALDAENERKIVSNLKTFYKGRTVVIVAHRLSTVKDADLIVVLDKGKVIETGTHENLTKAKGAYYRLVKNQLELGS